MSQRRYSAPIARIMPTRSPLLYFPSYYQRRFSSHGARHHPPLKILHHCIAGTPFQVRCGETDLPLIALCIAFPNPALSASAPMKRNSFLPLNWAFPFPSFQLLLRNECHTREYDPLFPFLPSLQLPSLAIHFPIPKTSNERGTGGTVLAFSSMSICLCDIQ